MPIFSLNNKNVLFLHVPKCGGSSIEEWARLNGFTTLLQMRGLPVQKALLASPQHLTMNQLQSIVNFENIDYAFMMVRNPVGRIKSEYCWSNRSKSKNNKRRAFSFLSRDLQSPCKPEPDVIEAWLSNALLQCRKNPFFMDNHIRPAVDFIENKNINIDIFKLEDGFDPFLRKMSEIFDKSFLSVPHTNKSSSFRQGFCSRDIELNEKSIDLIKNFYSADFQHFDYLTPG